MLGQGRVVDALHQRVLCQKFQHLFGVLRVPFQPQRERLDALQQQKRRKGRERRAGIPQQNRPDIGNKRRSAGRLREGDAVVAGVWRGNGRVVAGCRPIELAAVHDDAAQRCAVAAQELGRRMHDDIRPMLDGPQQIERAEGVIHDQGQAVGVRQPGQRVDIRDIAVGVAQRLDIEGAGVWSDGRLDFLQIMDIHKTRRDAKAGQGMRQQVVAAAVDGLLGDDVPAVLRQGLKGVGDGGGARGQRQCGHAPFQRRDPLFQDVLGGVGQPAVDVARVRQVKPGGGVRAVVKDVGGGGVDGDGSGVCGGVWRLLANVQLQGFKFVFTHVIVSFLIGRVLGGHGGKARPLKVKGQW